MIDTWSRIVTVKYSPTGDELWVRVYELGKNSGANDITVDDQGGVYVTGYSTGEGTGMDYVTIRYNASTGEEVWISHYNGPANNNDAARAIVVDNQGGVYVTGASYGPESYISTSQYATLRYDAATGAQTWVQRYGGEQNGYDQRLQSITEVAFMLPDSVRAVIQAMIMPPSATMPPRVLKDGYSAITGEAIAMT